MNGLIALGCKALTVIYAQWTGDPGKLRLTIARMGHVRWDDAGLTCRIYVPALLQEDVLDSVVESLSEYVGAQLERTRAETMAYIQTRPYSLEFTPADCTAVELSKWVTGIGWYEPGRLMSEAELETAWWHIISQVGPDRIRWHNYDPRLIGFG